MEESAFREAYMRKIVQRYAVHINLNEQKSVAELKILASPSRSEALRKPLERLSFSEYADACFEFVSSMQTIHAALPVSFWLEPKDLVELQAGDPLDKALLLVSLLNASQTLAWVRVVLLEDGLQHALVWVQLDEGNGKVWLLDSVHKLKIERFTLNEALADYAVVHPIKKGLYEFNHEEYREL